MLTFPTFLSILRAIVQQVGAQMSETSDYDSQIKEIEEELWAAIAALESQDLCAVRQCLDRAKTTTVLAWQSFRNVVGEVS